MSAVMVALTLQFQPVKGQSGGGNLPPAPADDSYTTNEDTLRLVTEPGVLANDIDPDGSGTLVVSRFDATSEYGAEVTVMSNGAFSYDPRNATSLQKLAAGRSLSDTFHYTVMDEGGGTNEARVVIQVSGRNDAPVALPDTAEVLEDVGLNIDVLINDLDIDLDDTFQIVSFTQPSHGTLKLVSETLKYTPSPDYFGEDSFVYRLMDSLGLTDSAVVTVHVLPTQDPPAAKDDVARVTNGEPAVLDPLFNDQDVDDDPLTLISFTQPRNGVVTPHAEGLLYTPDEASVAEDGFTYTVADDKGGLDTARIFIVRGNQLSPEYFRDGEGADWLHVEFTQDLIATDLEFGLQRRISLGEGAWMTMQPDGSTVIRDVIDADLPGNGASARIRYRVRMPPGPPAAMYIRMRIE